MLKVKINYPNKETKEFIYTKDSLNIDDKNNICRSIFLDSIEEYSNTIIHSSDEDNYDPSVGEPIGESYLKDNYKKFNAIINIDLYEI